MRADDKAFNISDKIQARHFPNVLSAGQSSRNVKELRESDVSRGQDRIDKSLKEYKEFRAVMKETIQEPGKDQKAPKVKKEKKDKGKEKAVEQDEEVEEEEEADDSAWLANKRKEALAEDAPAEATKSNVCLRSSPYHVLTDVQLSNQEQLILSSRRLFVRNLAFVTTRDELRDYFSTYGPIEECHLPVSKDKGQPLGTAYILFKDADNALEAYRKLDRRIFQGRILQVIASEPKNGWYGHSDPEFASHVLGKSDKAKGEVKKDIQKKSLENVKWAELYLNVSFICILLELGVRRLEDSRGPDRCLVMTGDRQYLDHIPHPSFLPPYPLIASLANPSPTQLHRPSRNNLAQPKPPYSKMTGSTQPSSSPLPKRTSSTRQNNSLKTKVSSSLLSRRVHHGPRISSSSRTFHSASVFMNCPTCFRLMVLLRRSSCHPLVLLLLSNLRMSKMPEKHSCRIGS
jgi:hypothetical protein